MKLKRKEQEAEDFQMAPMIDMVFLLLVFFMCVSTLAQADKSIPLDLAESEESKVPDDLSNRGTVSIEDDGTLYVGAKQVDLAEMQRRIEEAIGTNPELRVLVRADRGTPFGEIKKVLTACAEAGAYEVVYATYQKR